MPGLYYDRVRRRVTSRVIFGTPHGPRPGSPGRFPEGLGIPSSISVPGFWDKSPTFRMGSGEICARRRFHMQSTQVYAVSKAAGPDSFQVRGTDIPEPSPGQARVRVEAAGVSYGDLLFQRGVVPGGPKPPFVPGCDLTGTVEAVGPGVTWLRPGDRVTALVHSGGYCTVRNLPADRLVPVPAGLS